MQYALLVLIAALTAYFGNAILSRFPKGTEQNAFNYGNGNLHLNLRSKSIAEKEFKIGFVSYWEIGNEFAIYGDIVNCREGEDQFDLNGATSFEITVIPFGEWFDSNVIGRASFVVGERLSCVLHLPFQVTRQLLEDLRVRADREIWLQGKRLDKTSQTVVFHQLTMT